VTQLLPRWIRRTLREALWLPIAVLLVFVFAASELRLYDLYPWTDMPTHFAGGLAVMRFFRVGVFNAQDAFGSIPLRVQRLLALGLTMGVAVAWEIIEYVLDVVLGTNMNRGAVDTASDLFFGLLGGVCIVLYDVYASRRAGRERL